MQGCLAIGKIEPLKLAAPGRVLDLIAPQPEIEDQIESTGQWQEQTHNPYGCVNGKWREDFVDVAAVGLIIEPARNREAQYYPGYKGCSAGVDNIAQPPVGFSGKCQLCDSFRYPFLGPESNLALVFSADPPFLHAAVKTGNCHFRLSDYNPGNRPNSFPRQGHAGFWSTVLSSNGVGSGRSESATPPASEESEPGKTPRHQG